MQLSRLSWWPEGPRSLPSFPPVAGEAVWGALLLGPDGDGAHLLPVALQDPGAP